MKRCSSSLIIREMQIKTTVDTISDLSEWLSSINQQTSAREDVEKGEAFCTVTGIQIGAATVESSRETAQKLKMDLPTDPGIPLLRIYPKEPCIQNANSKGQNKHPSPMFIAVLFTIAKIRKQPKCPSLDKWIKQ